MSAPLSGHLYQARAACVESAGNEPVPRVLALHSDRFIVGRLLSNELTCSALVRPTEPGDNADMRGASKLVLCAGCD
jgi:hypothetical protein